MEEEMDALRAENEENEMALRHSADAISELERENEKLRNVIEMT
jgi:hypothetical protein